MLHHMLRAAAGRGGLPATTAAHRWALVETADPYEDTGTTGGLNGVEAGTVSHIQPGLGGFESAVSLAGAGAIDCDDVLDSLIAVNDAQFRIKFLVKFDSVTGLQFLVSKYYDGIAERQWYISASGDALRFAMFFANDTSAYRVLATGSGVITTGIEYEIEVVYDGTIDSGDGLDRVVLSIDGTPQSLSIIASAGSLGFIAPGTAHLGFGAAIRGNGVADRYRLSGKLNNIEVFEGV